MALQFSKHFFVRLPLGVNPCVCNARNGVVVTLVSTMPCLIVRAGYLAMPVQDIICRHVAIFSTRDRLCEE